MSTKKTAICSSKVPSAPRKKGTRRNNHDHYQGELFPIGPEVVGSRSTLRIIHQEISATTIPTLEEEQRLGVRIKRGDMSAVEELVNRNLRMPMYLAKRYVGNGGGVELADLFQIGRIVMWQITPRFDIERGCRYSSWVWQRVENALQKAVGQSAGATSKPKYHVALSRRVAAIYFKLLRERDGVAPTPEEVWQQSSQYDKKHWLTTVGHVQRILRAGGMVDWDSGDKPGDANSTVVARGLEDLTMYAENPEAKLLAKENLKQLTKMAEKKLDELCAEVNNLLEDFPPTRHTERDVRIFASYNGINPKMEEKICKEIAAQPGMPGKGAVLYVVKEAWRRITEQTGRDKAWLKVRLCSIVELAEVLGRPIEPLFRDYDMR